MVTLLRHNPYTTPRVALDHSDHVLILLIDSHRQKLEASGKDCKEVEQGSRGVLGGC